MDSPNRWFSIQTELILKSIEAIFEVRLHEKHKFRRAYSSNQNVVLQTMLIESPKIRDEDIDFNYSFPWTLSVNISLGTTVIEQWHFNFSLLDKHPNTDVYKQATISLRSVLALTQILPGYSLFLQGINLSHSFNGILDTAPNHKTRLILLKTQSGTLFLEVAYLKDPDNISNISQKHTSSIHGSNTPPYIEWQPVSLSVSSSSSDLSPPYSPLGQEILFSQLAQLPKYLTDREEDFEISVKKERKSYDVSQLARECSKILANMENVLKDVETNEEVLKEYYSILAKGGCMK